MVLTNQLKKYIVSLHKVKFRQKYNKFIAEGPKICSEFLRQGKFKVEYILCTAKWEQIEPEIFKNYKGKTIVINDKELKSISNLKTPNTILIVFEQTLRQINFEEVGNGWSLYLDRIQDPGNLGTILRIADWYGIKNVFTTKDSVDFYNPKVVQSAMGAHNRVEFDVLAKDELIHNFSNDLIALTIDGRPINEYNELEKGILVVGNESKGISNEIKIAAKNKVTIPRLGGAESLNAAVACGIAVDRFLR